ncbi:acylpyruvase FAHD1, mitochondrial-like [Acanthaster planci]|uniref:Oxaloacetate tautomerase FAHD1, mitochondrial n=1 Tax=Acanthaster planci TaxID=133434 RepID=A0A8B7YGF8_ACAPL|nr:acylpyruvase FAHD1, mitochondrial-like [Acanthaster planci]
MAAPSVSRFVETGRKIICVGRNYAAHAAELGNVLPAEPIIFLKPTTAFITEGKPIRAPPGCSNLHHEVELGVVVSRPGSSIPESVAMDHVGGYALALDMTARDLQDEAKRKGAPWTLAKMFDTSCPVSAFLDRSEVTDPHDLRLWLAVNGETRQDGNTKDMIFKIPALLSYISHYITLQEGDLVLTGTPSGVGPVKSGDVITCGLSDRSSTVKLKMSFTVAEGQ